MFSVKTYLLRNNGLFDSFPLLRVDWRRGVNERVFKATLCYSLQQYAIAPETSTTTHGVSTPLIPHGLRYPPTIN
jgi:hypothetical protein